MGKLISCVVFLALFALKANAAETFMFSTPQSTTEHEEGGIAMITIMRQGDATELAAGTMTTVSTACPSKVTATAASSDYTFTSMTVSFLPNDNTADVSVAIVQDNLEEFREFFCLTITTNPVDSDAKSTKVYIKGNDYCVETVSMGTTPSSNVEEAYDPNTVYIGPWFVGDSDVPDTINIDITPQMTGPTDGSDIFIFLTQNADKENMASIGNYYALYLDDTQGNVHAPAGTAVVGDSTINKNAVNTPVDSGILNDVNMGAMIADVVNGEAKFTLQYVENAGEITLTDVVNNRMYTETDTAAPFVDVSHLFVASGNNEYASWKVCGLSPRKLPIVGASARNQHASTPPDRVFDNNKGPAFTSSGCFIIPADAPYPWLQVDLGREFDVKMVIIYRDDGTAPAIAAAALNNADVYVGSCPSTDFTSITSNHACDEDIETVATQSPIVVTCNTAVKTYGRYVYLVQANAANAGFSLCEIEVYGDEIPIGEETMVEFSAPTFIGDENASTGITITATRTGLGLTCTDVDFYTDPSTTNDFTAVLSNNPVPLSWVHTDTTGTQKTTNVVINNDNNCESDETFNVYLTNAVGGTLGTQICSTVTITDEDDVVYAFMTAAITAVEGAAVPIAVTRTGTGVNQAGTVELAFTDGTTGPNDFTHTGMVEFTSGGSSPQSANIATTDDEAYEGDETFTVALVPLVPAACSTIGSIQTATVTITDNDSLFKFDTTSASITIPEGTSSTPITITRTGTVKEKTVDVAVATISATLTTDFTLSKTSVTFQPTDSSEQFNINVVDDSLVENSETFTLTLADPLYTIGNRNLETPFQLTVTIMDNDARYSWKQASYSTTEGVGSLTVSMIRTGDTTSAKTIQVTTTGGSATSGTDFTPLTQVVFDANSAEATANIPISNNNDVEPAEMFTITIVTGQQDVEVGSTPTSTITIQDDDIAVAWQSSSYSFNENEASNTVTLTKEGSGPATVTVTSQSGTATQGVDYEAISTELTFSGSTQSITVRLIDDTITDSETDVDETFTLTVSGTGITPSITTITIVDNDESDDGGLGTAAIAGITVAAIVGGIALVAGVVAAITIFGGSAAAGATAGAAAGAGAVAVQGATGAGALQTYPFNNFSGLNGLGGNSSFGSPGLNSFNSGLYSGYGNGLNNQGFGGIYQL